MASSSDSLSASGMLGLSASDGYPEDYRLIELTPEIVAQLEAHQASSAASTASVLRVRGRDADIATLIDLDDNTYHLHTAHTSNNLYLLSLEQPSAADAAAGIQMLQLRSKVNQTLELHKVQPQIRPRLLEVLRWDERGPFRGVEFDRQLKDAGGDQPSKQRVTDAVLAMHVQAGDRRLHRVLADIPALREPSTGCWRMMDPGYCMDLLRLILATQVERDWSLHALDATAVFKALRADAGGESLLLEAVEAVLARFGHLVSEPPSKRYSIDCRRVERFLAEQIFAAENMRAWPVPEFLVALQETMPPQLRRRISDDDECWGSRQIPGSLVRDLAYASAPIDAHLLYSVEGVPPQKTLLNPLFRSLLPQDPRERIHRLFEIKPRWSKPEIRPFLEDLVDVDLDLVDAGDKMATAAVTKAIDSWMIKFGRGVKSPSGDMVYTSRIN
ncbi:Ctf8p and Ctf18p associating protein [Coemansia sp. RSA 2599]|nr:Ctf8p and Ctf18p associating protein [Coemansia sp. RSA 2599]